MSRYAKYFILLGIIVLGIGLFGINKFLKTNDGNDSTDAGQVINNDMDIQEENKINDIEFNIVAGGDVMLSRHVGAKIRESGDDAMPFRKIAEIFFQADIGFVNLEAPFYNQGDYVTEGMVFKVEPEYIEGLKIAGIDMVSLANNHMRNRGKAGLTYTLNLLDENSIKYSGAGEKFSEAHQAHTINIKDLKIGFLSYTYSDGNNFVSSVDIDSPDVAFMDIEQMKNDMSIAKKDNDLVVVSMHAGIEYKSYPNSQQQEFAKAAIDSGAKLVLGHHPHVVQSTESYNNGYIIYSMGNLIFDQMWSEETREGIIAKINFINTDMKQIEFIPIKIENYSQPRLATEDESDRILKRMGLDNSIIEI